MNKQTKWVTAHKSSFHNKENKKREHAENHKTFKTKVIYFEETSRQVMHRIYAFMS